MKLLNIFKKTTKESSKASIQSLDKNQLEKVIGGGDERISMNVTVPKQTQGATFGEKVNAGLHAAGSAIANGTT
jgi:hypothetical protein